MNARDIQELFSFSVGVITLLLILYKVKSHRGSLKAWFPFIVITVMTLAYYVSVFAGLFDWSVTLRMTVQVSLLLYAWYMPPKRGG